MGWSTLTGAGPAIDAVRRWFGAHAGILTLGNDRTHHWAALPALVDPADIVARFERLSSLTLAVYAPLAYVFPSRLHKYEERYGNVDAGLNVVGGAVSIACATGRFFFFVSNLPCCTGSRSSPPQNST